MKKTGNTSLPHNANKLYLKHIIILISGFCIGILATYYFNTIAFDFSGQIQKARNLGMVSITILAGYPKSRDILMYMAVIGLPLIFSLGLWFLWARREHLSDLKGIFCSNNEDFSTKTAGWVLCLVSVIICYLFISFNINHFYLPGYNQFVGAWVLLGEEGLLLSCVQRVLSGEVYGKDFVCAYGPMMIYPLEWFMEFLGTTILVERFFKYALDLAAYGIVIYFLYITLRWKVSFVLLSLFYLFAFSMFAGLSPIFSYLRVILGILPLLFYYLYLENGKKSFLLITGVVVGQSLLFSQEVGICSVFALFMIFLVKSLLRRDWKIFTHEGLLVSIGCILSVLPMLAYFSINGAIVPFFKALYEAPRLYMLGYASLPFPDFKSFIAQPLSEEHLLFYWVIFVYIFSFIYLIPLLLLGKADKNTFLRLSLTIFGVLLYRKALGRSGIEQVYFVSHPAFLLVFLYLDSAVTGVLRKNFSLSRIGNAVMAIGLVTSVVLLCVNTSYLKMNVTSSLHFRHKWSLVNTGYKVPEIERGEIFFHRTTASSIIKINQFLNEFTEADDYVYFFPNEAMYYFLFNRKNPTKYAISYNAVTLEQRKDLVADLEEKRPEYVVYSLTTWRIDNIMEDLQVPEVLEYVKKTYAPVLDMGDIIVMKRVDT